MKPPFIQLRNGDSFPLRDLRSSQYDNESDLMNAHDETRRAIERVSLGDVALSLSKLCRFTGHTNRFYSVAEHCVMGYSAPELDTLALKQYWMLHECEEVIVGDLSSPLVNFLDSAKLEEFKKNLKQMFYFHFIGDTPNHNENEILKTVDLRMLRTEQRDIMPPEKDSWGIDEEPYDGMNLVAPNHKNFYLSFITKCRTLGL